MCDLGVSKEWLDWPGPRLLDHHIWTSGDVIWTNPPHNTWTGGEGWDMGQEESLGRQSSIRKRLRLDGVGTGYPPQHIASEQLLLLMGVLFVIAPFVSASVYIWNI
jgi:hypothetical protein